jgi:hypothetical protein
MVRLKPGQESFEVVDGPGAGLKFLRGKVYDAKTIPKTEAWRFEPVPKAADTQAADGKKTAKTDKKGA